MSLTLCAKQMAQLKVVEDNAHGKFRIEVRDKLNNLVAIGEKK
jgi:hypothetical protein